MERRDHDHDFSEILKLGERLLRELIRLVERLAPQSHLPIGLSIKQLGESMITGVPAGGKGTFLESYVPANAALPAGASISIAWTCDDPAVVLTPSADGTSIDAAVPATDTQGSAPAGQPPSFNLTATGTSAALPAPITSGPVNVPILPATAPPLPTALTVNQTA